MNNKLIADLLKWVDSFFDSTLAITIEEETFYGVISDIKVSNDIDRKNPAMNAFKVRFTVGDNITHLTYKFRQILAGRPFVSSTFMKFNDIFTGEKQEIREERQIFTGNLLKAYELIGDKGSGKVVTYMTSDGNRETGILMAKKWKVGEMSRDPRNELDTPNAAFDELQNKGHIVTADGNLSIQKSQYRTNEYFLSAEKKRSEGGKYFLDENITDITGDFFSRGGRMRAYNVSEAEVKKVIDYLYNGKTKFRKVSSSGVQFSKTGDLQTESKKQKSSTVAKSSTGLSQPFPDYRGLGGNSIKIATAALQSVEHDHNIASASKKVNGYFEKAKKILSDIKNGNPVFVNRFLETLLNMGFVKHGRDSVYFQVDDLSTIRLSNHTANASNFSTIGENASNVSLVLRSAITGDKKFGADENVNLLELQFGKKFLDKSKLPILLADIAHFLATGEYIDNVGALKFDISGNENFKKKVLDNLYLSAVNRGDMKTVQKMVENAAKRAGYTIKAYHGAKEKFTVFRKGEKRGWLGKGIYFADNKKYAKTNGKNVVSAYLSIKNPYIAQANSPNEFFAEVHKKYPEANNYDIAEIIQENGYDGIVYNHWDSDIGKFTVVFDPEQIKSAELVVYDDNGNIIPLSERFNPEKNDIRFSLTGDLDLGDTSLSPEDYRRSIDPLFDFVLEYTDGIVNPGPDHIGEDFDGSYISEAYNKFSTPRKQGKNESDASYRRYLAHREEKLKKADGYALDSLAAAYVDKFGGDEKEVAEKILDMLRYLRKRDLISDRAEARQKVREFEKEQRKEDIAAMRELKEKELQAQVNDLFEAKEKPTIDKRWVQMHRILL